VEVLLHVSPFVAVIIALALLFDFLNGMHDAANSIATIVSTQVLRPRQAVAWAAFFNFVAAFFFGVHVANTIGKGLVDPSVMDNTLLFSALIGASLWNWLTIVAGIPVSSSHSLIGGLVGAGVAKAGFGCLVLPTLAKTATFMVLSPPIGMLFAMALMAAVFWLFRKQSPGRVNHFFHGGQLLSSAVLSLGHGTNDSQKTMGIISVLLFTNGYLGKDFFVPKWVMMACYAVMGLGTLAGGWKVVHTMGNKVTKLKPFSGFCAETGAGLCILICSHMGIPVSTTHVVTGSVVGVGAAQRVSAVRWGVAGSIVWAWVLTIPCAAAVSALTYFVTSRLVH
jgi:PiT family inorganic phosphate transporter